ncbi:hypothetical protein [Shimia sp.]|uniref:hypothetical protein n=1 Tax=Shimia sp. TaxID=1954381 RepID=UPI0025D592D3|nr:hypothetical protein [Shimia sp.]
MAPRSKTQKQKAGQAKRTQRQRMGEYGLQEVTVYVPKDEAEGLRSRSSKLVAAARAKSVLDSMNKEDVKALEALGNKDFEQFAVPQSSGSDEPHKDHIIPNCGKSAETGPQTPQIPPSRPQMQPSAPAGTSTSHGLSAHVATRPLNAATGYPEAPRSGLRNKPPDATRKRCRNDRNAGRGKRSHAHNATISAMIATKSTLHGERTLSGASLNMSRHGVEMLRAKLRGVCPHTLPGPNLGEK